MNQQLPLLVLACCALWCVGACANTAVGTDGGAVDVVGERAGADAGVDALTPAMWPQPDPAAPRLVAPLSCTWHSSRRPTLRWALPAGVERVVVEVCADRPCQRVEHTLEVSGDSVRVPEELRPGVHFWRAFALVDGRRGAGSFTWEFRAPFRSAPNDLAVATYVDVNGDGYGDAIFGAGNALAPVVYFGLYVYFGGPNGPSTTYNQRLPDGGAYDSGDVNGDGFSDVIISGRSDPKDVPNVRTVYLGSPTGLLETTQQIGHTPSGRRWGGSFSTLGDVDLDGYADVSYTFAQSSQPAEPTTIFLGSSTGYNARRSFELVRPDPRFHRFGAIYQVGDFDGDNLTDLLVEGSPLSDREHPFAPEFWVIAAEHLREFSRYSRNLLPPEGHLFVGLAYGEMLRHCDLNGDGRSELMLQSEAIAGVIDGPLNIYLHSSQPGPLLRASIFNAGSVVRLRNSLAIDFTCVPDFDGDGFSDMIGTDYGTFINWVVRGSASGGMNAVIFSDNVRSDASWTSRRATNDIDGDGRSDCIIAGAAPEALIFTARDSALTLSIRYRVFDPGSSGNYGGPGPFGGGFLF